jgi:hypothetical protein
MLSRQLSPQENMVQEKYQFWGSLFLIQSIRISILWHGPIPAGSIHKNIAQDRKPYDTFILKCSSDFDPLISGLQVSDSTLTWARWMPKVGAMSHQQQELFASGL